MGIVQPPVPWLVDALTCCWVGKEGCRHSEETVWLMGCYSNGSIHNESDFPCIVMHRAVLYYFPSVK